MSFSTSVSELSLCSTATLTLSIQRFLGRAESLMGFVVSRGPIFEKSYEELTKNL